MSSQVINRRPARNLDRLRRSSIGLLIMLIVQFGIGTAYNLYGKMPSAHRSTGGFSSGPVLAVHVILGILLIVAAVTLVVQAIAARHRATVVLAVVGLLSIAGAAESGSAFLDRGANGASMGMAIATGLAMLCYTIALRITG